MLDQRAGNQSQVGSGGRALHAGGTHPASVDQKQGPVRAEPPKVCRLRTGAVVKHETGERHIDLRTGGNRGLLHDLLGVDDARLPGDFAGDDLQGSYTGVGVALEPGTGNDDLFDVIVVGRHHRRLILFFILVLCQRRR